MKSSFADAPLSKRRSLPTPSLFMQKIQDVVVIEDSVNVLRLVTRYFERQGVRVASARQGPEGIQLIHELHPDLIVCDHSVERSDGLYVLRAIRANADTEATPFIYTSSDLSPSVYETVMRHGADAFLEKPYTLKEVDEAIIKALAERGVSERE